MPMLQRLNSCCWLAARDGTGISRIFGNDVICRAAQVYLEDAGFDWKILGPDVSDFDYVAWQCDQDAYAATGQKCSAQSILFQHSNWVDKGDAFSADKHPTDSHLKRYIHLVNCCKSHQLVGIQSMALVQGKTIDPNDVCIAPCVLSG